MPAGVLKELHSLWLRRGQVDEYVGTLVNAWIADGGEAWGARIGRSYVNVGTLHGYREAIGMLSRQPLPGPAAALRDPAGERMSRLVGATPQRER